MANSKIIFAGEVLMDLTADTVTPDKLLKGITAHNKAGVRIEGSCTFDSDTQSATAAAAEILKNKTAYVRGAKITGTMQNNGRINAKITSLAAYKVPIGYHDGSGTVDIDQTEKAKLIPSNIRDGVSILGVIGSMTGSETVRTQAKTVRPTKAQQTVLPDVGYTALSQVTVEGIPYQTAVNSAGGTTVTIG